MLLKHLVLFIYATGLYILGLYIWFLDNDHLFWKVFLDEPLEPVYDYIVGKLGIGFDNVVMQMECFNSWGWFSRQCDSSASGRRSKCDSLIIGGRTSFW